MIQGTVLPTERRPKTEQVLSLMDESVTVVDHSASLRIQGSKMCLAVAFSIFWPEDPGEALVAVMDFRRQVLPFHGNFSMDAGLNVLIRRALGSLRKISSWHGKRFKNVAFTGRAPVNTTSRGTPRQ